MNLHHWLHLLRIGPRPTVRLMLRNLASDLERTFFPRLHRRHCIQYLRRIGRIRRKQARAAWARLS